jgi:hypothetical protein
MEQPLKQTNIIIILVLFGLFFISCEDWLSQEDSNAITPEQAYSSVSGISSVAANLYSRLRYEQDFETDNESYDLSAWDEASNNSAYWSFAGNKNQDYRSYYDYNLIRAINMHIQNLKNYFGANIKDRENNQRYFIAEARYLRAFVYFILASRMGGVPVVEDVMEYTNDPLTLAKPRNKESEVYDFICRELDEITEDLDLISASVKTRATKGSALALKCRAMLYAGTIAYNYDKNVAKGLVLPSGVTGIEKSRASDYFQKCLDAYWELEKTGYYSLYAKNSDLSINYTELFINKSGNPELIFYKDYDGTNSLNYFTARVICRGSASGNKIGAQINPVLNLVDCYEKLSSKQMVALNPYKGENQLESMGTTTSSADYIIYDHPADVFVDRDRRLSGTVIYPGVAFRGKQLDFQAGLAIKTASGFEFKSAPTMDDITHPDKGHYKNVQLTGIEGPHRDSYYVSHTGFLMRKYVDTTPGSEVSGVSNIPYVVFRYGEVILNAAEAAFYLSENGITRYQGKDTRQWALDCINAIRKRAGGDAFSLTNSELNFDRIVNERRVELAFEDHRYNDLKRWRIADEIWTYDPNDATSVMLGLYPYKIYAPGEAIDGKWLYRRVKLEHRGSESNKGQPLNFDVKMYYATYPITEGNPFTEKNPNH